MKIGNQPLSNATLPINYKKTPKKCFLFPFVLLAYMYDCVKVRCRTFFFPPYIIVSKGEKRECSKEHHYYLHYHISFGMGVSFQENPLVLPSRLYRHQEVGQAKKVLKSRDGFALCV